jgi:mono/diheme cytochrome c family protein
MKIPYAHRPIRHLGALLLTAALASASYADDSDFTSDAGFASANGQQTFEQICQGCHMPEGQGAVGAGFYPKLAGDPALTAWQYVALTVLTGKHGMPPFGLPADQVMETRTVHLSDAQVADVVNYVRSHFGNHFKGTVTATQVAALPHPGAPSEH